MNILGLPFTSIEGAVDENVARAIEAIRHSVATQQTEAEDASAGHIDLVILPELFTCGYCARNLAPYAESLDGPTMERFRKCSSELNVWIGYGFAEEFDSEKVYNAWALVGPGGETHVYRKTHLHPASPGSAADERAFLKAGDLLEPFATSIGVIGVMICYDGCFVETPRTLVLKGAEVILWPSRSGGYLASRSLPSVRALDNTVPIAQVEGGQMGSHMPLDAWSMVASATGEMRVSQCGSDAPFRVALDIEEGRRLRQSREAGGHSLYYPRRPELYGVISAFPTEGK